MNTTEQVNVQMYLGDRTNTPNVMALVVGFVRWMDARRDKPEWRHVAERWSVSRATAYRWIHGYCAATGRWP